MIRIFDRRYYIESARFDQWKQFNRFEIVMGGCWAKSTRCILGGAQNYSPYHEIGTYEVGYWDVDS